MESPDFEKFGMTKVEARIYQELLLLKTSGIGKIIKRTGFHRGTVYNALNKLIAKGFISFRDEDGRRLYKASKENIFYDILEEKIKDLSEEKNKIEKFFENLEILKERPSEHEVNVFYGLNSFKTLFMEIYDFCEKNNTEYLFLGKGGEMQNVTGMGYYKYTQDLKKQKDIKCRVILDRESIVLDYHKYVSGNLRYLSTKVRSPVNFWIYGDSILLILFGSSPLTSIKIKSKPLVNAFRNYFEDLWKIAKP